MRIKSVAIKNFRALDDVFITFDSVTTFIGANGSGKSTVLRALDWFFNGARNGELTAEDCSFGAIDENIEVRVTFSDLSSKDRVALGKYAPGAATSFSAWKIRAPNGLETFSANARSYLQFAQIRDKSSAAERKIAYNALRDADSTLALPIWANQDAALEALVIWESNHPEQLEESPETQQTKFFGFNSGGKMSDLFDFVLVTGDLRASEEVQDSKSTVIGKILERSVDRAAADEAIAEIVETTRVLQQKVYSEKFAPQLDAMKMKLNQVVSSYSPGRSIQVVPSEVDLKAPKTTRHRWSAKVMVSKGRCSFRCFRY
jgi:putative ATP-dependent endonuclease of OLD family